MIEVEGPNAAQIEYWNEVSGPKWVRLGDDIDRQIAPLGREVMDLAGFKAGEKILDIGCGCGHTTLELAERVGPTGSVLGLDISGPMLESARSRAKAAHASNVEFLQADGQTHDFGAGGFDHIVSRFGVMFFADPTTAFNNLMSALRPGGTLHFACWQAIQKNSWMLIPAAAIAKHIPLPAPKDPDGPGPFAFADADRLRGILEGAGLAEVRIEALDSSADIGGGKSLDETVEFIVQMGPAGQVFREASPELQRTASQAVREAITPFQTESGILLDAAVWMVSARRPE